MRIPTVIDTVTLLALAGLTAIVAIPQQHVRSMMANEDQVVKDLRFLEKNLVEDQKAARRDADHDGTGEYAPLTEILGARREAARRVGDTDVWILDGYRFAVMVPGESRTGRRHPVLAASKEAVTDWAEVTYLIVAWPAEPGKTGMLAYAAAPQGILRHQIDGYPYGSEPPAPEWPMVLLDGDRLRRNPCTDEKWKVPLRLPSR